MIALVDDNEKQIIQPPRIGSIFRQQIHSKDSSDNMFELLKPEDEWKTTESIIEDILHWADDGGQMLDIGSSVYPSNSDMAGEQANE